MNKETYDVIIIGAGIIGLATALKLLEKKPNIKLGIIEKDSKVGQQQSGHNSGVIHSGIYYKPGSFKANFCVAGRKSMTDYCLENEIPVWTCGKLIVATDKASEARLDDLEERGKANNVEGLRIVYKDEIREIEPHVSATKALYAPKTGIVDYTKVSYSYYEKILNMSGDVFLSTKVIGFEKDSDISIIKTNNGEIKSKNVINCAGLHSDIIAETMDVTTDVRIIPFRGEYYKLSKDSEHLVKGLIYPVPDPAFPFLGVHLTQTMKGWVEAGPNAVLAWKKEGYSKTDFSINDALRTLSFKGFWKLSLRDWKTGLWEINRSLRKNVFLNSLRKLVPELKSDDLSGKGSGVRAQAVDNNGTLVDDFKIIELEKAIHVLNAPSPGATASLVIGAHIAGIAENNFNL